MPKASSSSARPALRRNQACLACRKRKLKCDAARPHCGTCVKQWQSLISVPPPVGYAHPTEPQCSYDPVEGLTVAPDVDPAEKMRQMQEEISQLKTQLYQLRDAASHSNLFPGSLNGSLRPLSSSLSNGRSPENSPHDSGIVLPSSLSSSGSSSGPSTSSPSSRLRSPTKTPDSQRGPNPMMDLFLSGWDPYLPPPDTLHHYVDVFFRCDPCSSHVLHRQSFLASLHLHPKDPNFPHTALLHAICASASRWASNDIMMLPEGSRRDRFAELHVSKTREYIDRTMASGQDIFPVLQACLMLSWYFYQEGRWVEVWIFAGFQARVAVPLRLNNPGTFSGQSANTPGAFLPPPKNFRELESRRRAWWMTVLFDRIVSVGGWMHAIDEKDIGTEFPVRRVDFEADSNIPNNPQDLASKDLYTRNDPQYTDSFILFLKSIMLFGKVTDYNTRSSLRAPGMPSKNQNPFHLLGFSELDKLVYMDFVNSFPQPYSHLGVSYTGALDTDLYMAHVAPHAAVITLHNPFMNFNDPHCISTNRCIHAARTILNAYYKLSETSLDTTRLHPFITICWYLAAVVKIQVCKYMIEIGDGAQEATLWGEINTLRFAMLTYGARSPIGVRQEKLLQGLMTEIVRISSQMRSLEVGVPLYPFSHARLFSKEVTSTREPIPAPLPGVQSFEEETAPSPQSFPNVSPTLATQIDAWDTRQTPRHSQPQEQLHGSSGSYSESAQMYQAPAVLSVPSYNGGF
ncbi:uncharacterized protein LAESUDRAFT_207675 [Laetiporus sulphureus 93-53]|uniref:Zn(2)-C6 fungal-type domain-containing protein n=1 Tax=Laetiporus sulphureus 93-53 TaxID=1314785 RepID=A0A165DZM9_9APHY|nr:uncharacterized protein LAESUDRAFT_207675 [Laetiporus sulphureus 93-53]KZT05966.1 hypothetical protein LAESUDRAFT_207675 [Laetiporus sulphureus 93-53]